jgi:NAD(P)-dependent dehydrogenase (short-subunit alcohol dehydrogenase family)
MSRPLAVVTGGRRGIGAGIATLLAARGFDLALTDIDTADAADTLAAISAHGARVTLLQANLGDAARHPDLVDQIVAWGGPIACLVNNAGVPAAQRADLLQISAQAYDSVLDVNLRGTFFFTQAVARHMVATPHTADMPPRSIITISSVSAEMASIVRGEYCLSKAGLAMLTKLFALRLAPHGIGVFEVRPGIIRTPMTDAVAGDYDQRIADGLVPMARWGTPQDVAQAVAALATGQFAFSTGSVINVDGALSVPRF